MFQVLVGLTLGLASATVQPQQVNGYNAKWWVRQASDAQIAYLAGDNDCYVSDVQGNAYPTGGLSESSVRRVSQYLRTHPAAENAPLPIILRRVFEHDKHPIPTKRIKTTGEYWPEKHGFFDGDYWWQLGDEGRAPYVAGYLACELTFRHRHVTRPIDFYVQGLDRWYGTAESPRDNDKIADVIERHLRR